MSAVLEAVETVALEKDVPLALLPMAARVAQADPERPGRHVEIDCGKVMLPDDADTFTLYCDRSNFPDVKGLVAKCRARLVNPDGSETLLVAFTTCAPSKEPGSERFGKIASATPARIPSGKNRVVSIQAVVLQDVQLEVGVSCNKRGEPMIGVG